MTKKPQKKKCLPDEEIIELYWSRDEKAISETDRKYGKYLYTIAFNILHDRLDSEECTNDTYLGTWNSIPPARPNIFQAFISRIMRNIAINRYKHNTIQRHIPSELTISLDELGDCIPADPSAERETEIRLLAQALNEYLDGLSEREEFEFICRYYYADTVETIASMLKVSESTVRRDLLRIRDGLKDYLEKKGMPV